jgi:hypothetical protein
MFRWAKSNSSTVQGRRKSARLHRNPLPGLLLLLLYWRNCRRRSNVAPRVLRVLIGNVFGRGFVIVVDLLLPLLFCLGLHISWCAHNWSARHLGRCTST